MPAADRAYALTMRDSSGIRSFRGRYSVSGVCTCQYSHVQARCRTYAFWRLDIQLDYAAHSLKLRTHICAGAVQLDRLAELHLAIWVHAPFLLESLAVEGSSFADLRTLARLRWLASAATHKIEPRLVVLLRVWCRVPCVGLGVVTPEDIPKSSVRTGRERHSWSLSPITTAMSTSSPIPITFTAIPRDQWHPPATHAIFHQKKGTHVAFPLATVFPPLAWPPPLGPLGGP